MFIKEVVLLTSDSGRLKDFYTETLGLDLTAEDESSFSVNTRSTSMTFRNSGEIKDPFYHFAFNIPENQFKEAKQWAIQRADLIKLNGEDEFDFKSWNAHSVYFYDTAGNIIELIARHNLNNSSQKAFSGKSLLSISEIGFPVHNVEEFFNIINRNFNIPDFSGDLKTFTAAGDDNGLFIIVPGGRKWFPDCPDAKIFPIAVKIITNTEKEIDFKNLPYKIIPFKS